MKRYRRNARFNKETSYGAILHIVGEWGDDHVTVSLVAALLDVSRSAAHKLLSDMVFYGWLEDYKVRDNQREYYYRLTLSGGYHYEKNKRWCSRALDKVTVIRGNNHE